MVEWNQFFFSIDFLNPRCQISHPFLSLSVKDLSKQGSEAMQDRELIALYWARDERAIAETIKAYGAYCYAIAHRILNSAQDAEECVNDTWLNTWNAIPPQRPNCFSAFLAKITRGLALNRWSYETAKKRGGGAAVLAVEELEDCIPAGTNPEQAVEAAQLAEDVQRFLAGLPERERSIFLLRYFSVLSVSEIAKQRRLTENNVSAILSRTRKKLKAFLVKEGYFS